MTAGAAPGGDETASPAPGTYLDLAADAWAPALQRFACFGSRVLVCDNLAFSADHVIKRKDTVRAKRELPGLLSEIILPLKDQRLAQNQRLLTYRETPLD